MLSDTSQCHKFFTSPLYCLIDFKAGFTTEQKKMSLKTSIERLDSITGKVSKGFAFFGSYCIFLLMLFVTLHVLMRYFFDTPIPGAVEIIEFVMVFIVFLGFGQVTYAKANVAVEVVMMRFPWPIQRIVAIIMNILGAVLLTFIVWQTTIQTGVLKSSNQISGVLHIPYFPFYIVLVIGYSVFILAIVVETLKLISGDSEK